MSRLRLWLCPPPTLSLGLEGVAMPPPLRVENG